MRLRARVTLALALVAFGAGAIAMRPTPPRDSGPGSALREAQRARMNAIAECAKYGFSVEWGDVRPDSRIAAECMSLVSTPCGERVGVPDANATDDAPAPVEL